MEWRNVMWNAKSLLLVILLAASPAAASAQDGSSIARSENKPSSGKNAKHDDHVVDEAVIPATNDANYTIGPEDEVNVSIWKEQDLSRTVPVRPDGKISLPLLNDIRAAGLTPMQLSSEITEKLKKFIAEPQVTVIITKINSQRVFIVGEVPRAGAFALLPNMTVLQALSSAGGFTQFANVKKIHILRMENGKQISLAFNYKEVVAGHGSEQNITLRAGDTIVVP